MSTATSTPIPASPASYTHILHACPPAPLHWPAPLFDGRALLAARRGQREAHPATVAAVAACVAMVEGVL